MSQEDIEEMMKALWRIDEGIDNLNEKFDKLLKMPGLNGQNDK